MGKTQILGSLVNTILTDSSNNVGIGGAANASFKLQVTGTTNLTGALTGGAVATFTAAANPLILKSTAATTMYTEYYYNTSTLSGYIGNGSGILTGANNSDFIVRSEADLVLATGNNRRMTIASSTGAATFSSAVNAQLLTIQNGYYLVGRNAANTSYRTLVTFDSSNKILIGQDSDITAITLGVNSEAMRITSSGNVGIGTSNPTYLLQVNSSTTAAHIHLTNSTTGSTSNDGTRLFAAGLDAYLANREAGAIIFETSDTERMRITGGGNVGIGSTGDAAQRLRVQGVDTGTSNYGIVVADSTTASTMFVRNDGYGYLKASAWAYGSDLRMKENISDVENGLDMVLKMKPKHFDYIDGVKDNIGFIAQDIQEIIPQAVSISEESTGMLALKTDFIIPHLVKAIQEQQAQIEELKELIKNK